MAGTDERWQMVLEVFCTGIIMMFLVGLLVGIVIYHEERKKG